MAALILFTRPKLYEPPLTDSDNDSFDEYYKNPIVISSSDDESPAQRKSVEAHQAKFSRAVDRAQTAARKKKNNRGTDLRGVNLAGADLTGTVFSDDIQLRDANLQGVKGLNPQQVAYARQQGALNVPNQGTSRINLCTNRGEVGAFFIVKDGVLDNPLQAQHNKTAVVPVMQQKKEPRQSWCQRLVWCRYKKPE